MAHPSIFYWKVAAAGFVVGAGMELFMIKTGFYDVVTRLESERLQETLPEKEEFLRKLQEHHQALQTERKGHNGAESSGDGNLPGGIRMQGAVSSTSSGVSRDAPGLGKMLEGMPGMEGMSKDEVMAYQEFLEKQAAAAGMPVPGQTPSKDLPRPPRNASVIVNTRFTKAPSKRPPPPPGGAPVTLAAPGPMVHVVIALWVAAGPRAADLGPASVEGVGPLSLEDPPEDWCRVQVPFRMRMDPFEQRTSEGKSAIIYEVACHKDTVSLALSDDPGVVTFRHVLMELAFRRDIKVAEMRALWSRSWLEGTQKIGLGRSSRQMRLLTNNGAEGPGDPAAVAAAAAAGTGAAGMSQGLLDQLAGLGTSVQTSPGPLAEGGRSPINKKDNPRPLIQEVSEANAERLPKREGHLPLQYKVELVDAGWVQICFQAPQGVKASDFDLEAEVDSIIISPTAAFSRTAVTLPARVDPETVKAKFDKKARHLTVKLKIINS